MAAMREGGRPGTTRPDLGRVRLLPVVVFLVVAALVGGGVAAYLSDEPWFDLGVSESGGGRAGGPGGGDHADTPTPGARTLALPAPAAPSAVASPVAESDLGSLRPRAASRVLAPLLDDSDLGPHVLGLVADLSTGEIAFRHGSGTARPASLTKLLTAAAALEVLGGEHRFETGAVLQGRTVVLVGGGDPYLMSKPDPEDPIYPERADVWTLARATAKALAAQGVTRVRVAYDDSLFSGPDASPHWEADYVPDGIVAPIRALWVDEGRPPSGLGRVADPSLVAAQTFARALRTAGRQQGLRVDGPPVARRTRPDAVSLASVHSAPVAQIVERVLTVSDNEAAEVLAHQVGLASVGEASFAGGIAGTRQTLEELGVSVSSDRFYDGSGLARDNRLRPETLVAVLRLAAADDHPELRALLTGLPVAGFTGSLADRFADTPVPSRGRVRAKTGTLSGTSGLAGLATDQDGTTVAFVLMADRVRLPDTLAARDALDDAAAALATCRCSR